MRYLIVRKITYRGGLMKKICACVMLSLLVVSLLARCGKSPADSPVDQFEKLVDEMVSLFEKGLAGDLGALQDVAKLQPKLAEIKKKLQGYKPTEEEQARLLKIGEKLASVFGGS
jgi:hypothetical protein